jgi:hypothetical protein
MRINHDRPVEPLVGENYDIVRMRLGNVHCMSSVLSQARIARPRNMRSVPVELRRGWALCVLETIRANRELYVYVMKG